MPTIKVGFFEDDITGPIGFPQTGYMERTKVSEGINDRLYCRVLSIGYRSQKYVLISLDLCGVDKKFREKTCSMITDMTNIPKEHVMISATHTHSGMDGFLLGWNFKIEKFPYIRFYKSKDIVGEENTQVVRNFVSQKVAGSVYASTLNMHDSSISLNSSNVLGICSNRETPNMLFDSELITLKFQDVAKRPIGCIINYSCHPTVLSYDNYLYSADFVGYTCELVKSHFGPKFVPIYFNGACAEISTRFTRKEQTVDEAKRLGYLLGNEVVSLLKKEVTGHDISDVNVSFREIKLPTKKLPSLEEAQKNLKKAKENYDELKRLGASPAELRIALTKVDGALDVLGRIEVGDFKDEIIVPLQSLRLDDIVILGVPCELHSSIALDLKQYGSKLRRKILVVGYANDYAGYILPPEEYKKENYETIISQFNEEGASLFISELKALINSI